MALLRSHVLYLFSYCFRFSSSGNIYMMLIISVLSYHATVHPLKHDSTRTKLKIVSGLGFILDFIAGYAAMAPESFLLNSLDDLTLAYTEIFINGFLVSCFYFFPTLFMAIVYYKIHQTLVKQNKQTKQICSNAMKSSHIRNRRTFLVWFSSALCYGHENVLMSVWLTWSILFFATTGQILNYDILKYLWINYFGGVLRTPGSRLVNPLICGILHKKFRNFLGICFKDQRKADENEAVLV